MVLQLTSLLNGSNAFLLAYSVPLLIVSALITLSGTFLILDRSHSFTPRSDVTPSLPGALKRKHTRKTCKFRLGGGVGGLATGYVFGLHASTFLCLLISNETSTSELTPTTFFITWLFSIIPTVALAARWQMVALAFLGMSGGISLSIALSIITHPSLTSRVVIASVFTPLITIMVVIPSALPSLSDSQLAHLTARIASSCLGSFSVTMAIALLTRSNQSYSWANAWDRLWVPNGSGWGTSRERGFDALFCVLWASGALVDWALKKWIGEDPEEKWDTYLAEYSSTLPNTHDRAGRFVPLRSWWARLLSRLHLVRSSPARPHEIISPGDGDFSSKADYTAILGGDTDHKSMPHLSREELQKSITPVAYNWDPPKATTEISILRKGKARKVVGFKSTIENQLFDAENKPLDLSHCPTLLQKAKDARADHSWKRISKNRRRAPVEFKPKDGFSSESDTDDSSEDDESETVLNTPCKGTDIHSSPLVRTNSSATSLSGTTVHPPSNSGNGLEYDIDSEKARLMNMKAALGESPKGMAPARSAPEYSDVEEDVTAAFTRIGVQPRYGTAGWKPGFLQRESSNNPATRPRIGSLTKDASPPPVGAVTMTPSLVNALGRIAKAQADANGPLLEKVDPGRQSQLPQGEHITIAMEGQEPIPGLPITRNEGKGANESNEIWTAFWNEIQAKAGET